MSKEIEWLKKLKRGSEKEYPCGSVQDNELVANNKEKQGVSTKGMPLPARKGFSAVAGMDDLKLQMKEGFINVLQHPCQAQRYGVTVPNILFYGPAGCGKTYFAERVAEEVGINFMKIVPDDLASPFIHGTQQKIAEVFQKAEAAGPTLLFFDEFDCMVPRRTGNANSQYQVDEVDEFLTMLNNSCQRGIYVIAATNRPDSIDSVVMRTGRIDEKIYIPMPDVDTRAHLFRYELNARPASPDIDFNVLAEKSKGYNCSDISYIVKLAARKKFNSAIITSKSEPISQEDLELVIQNTRPSVSEREVLAFERMSSDFAPKTGDNVRYKVGF